MKLYKWYIHICWGNQGWPLSVICLENLSISREKTKQMSLIHVFATAELCLPPHLCIFPLQIQIPKVTAISSLASGDESIIEHCQQDVAENKPKCFHYFHPITLSYPLLGRFKYCNFTVFCFYFFQIFTGYHYFPLHLSLSSFNLSS